MIIDADSPFRRIRSDLNPEQASFLDAIRLSVEMVDIGYQRLVQTLCTLGADDPKQGLENYTTALVFLDAWSVVDNTHRLRELLEQMPGIKRSRTPSVQIFLRKTESVKQFRHVVQHLRTEIRDLAQSSWPVWGSLKWLRLMDASTSMFSSFVLLPGRTITGQHEVINPCGRMIRSEIDHVTLFTKGSSICLSELRRETTQFVEAFEPILRRLFAGHAKVGSDCLMKAVFQAAEELTQSEA